MRVIFGCESARKGSYQAIRTFPLGYASYSQTEVNTLLFRQKSSYSIRSGPKVIHNEHCFQSATDFLIYMQIGRVWEITSGHQKSRLHFCKRLLNHMNSLLIALFQQFLLSAFQCGNIVLFTSG